VWPCLPSSGLDPRIRKARSILCLPGKEVNGCGLTPCLRGRYNEGVAEVPKSVRKFLKTMAREGGFARAVGLSPEQRRKIARKAARARWAKKRRPKAR
jgi:hypothetical protein